MIGELTKKFLTLPNDSSFGGLATADDEAKRVTSQIKDKEGNLHWDIIT